MHSRSLLPALLAASASLVSAKTCTKDIEISDPNPTFDCDTIDAEVTVNSQFSGPLSIEGVEEIKSLVISNTSVSSLTSSTLTKLGSFELNNLKSLTEVSLAAVSEIDELKLINLNLLNSITFDAKGITKANTIVVTDTRINDLSAIKLSTVDTIELIANDRLKEFDSDLVNITGVIKFYDNAAGMNVSMLKLKDAGEIQLRGVSSFDAPLLKSCSKGLKFDNNPDLESYTAPNLTKAGGSLTFINNKKLSNISFPVLTEIIGDMTIVNNSGLVTIDGFSDLKKVTGAILLGGDFEEVELPALEDVAGTVTVTTTTDKSDFCDFFNQAKDDKKIQGENFCSSKNEDANKGEKGGDTSSGSGGSGSGSGDDGNAAGMASVNMALLGLAGLAAFAQFL